MVMNYCHITPNIVYGCVSYHNVLSIGEHMHLVTTFVDYDMQEANKGLHYLDGYPHLENCNSLYNKEGLSKRTGKGRTRKGSYTQIRCRYQMVSPEVQKG